MTGNNNSGSVIITDKSTDTAMQNNITFRSMATNSISEVVNFLLQSPSPNAASSFSRSILNIVPYSKFQKSAIKKCENYSLEVVVKEVRDGFTNMHRLRRLQNVQTRIIYIM